MADITTVSVGGSAYNIKDPTARTAAEKVTTAEELDRRLLLGAPAFRNLATEFASEIGSKDPWVWLADRVKANNLAGLRIGDYIEVPIAEGPRIKGVAAQRFHIAAWNNPSGHATDWKNVVTMVPSSSFAVIGGVNTNGDYLPWNTTNTNNGTAEQPYPYLGSNLHDWEINAFIPALPQTLQDRMVPRKSLLPKRYSAGSTPLTEDNGWDWKSLGKAWSLSETELYGQVVFGSKGGYSVGESRHLQLFNLYPQFYRGVTGFWLRSVSAGSSSCDCYNNGNAYSNDATNVWNRPLPCFFLG